MPRFTWCTSIPPSTLARPAARTRIRTERAVDGDRVGFGGHRYRTTTLGALSFRDRFGDYLGFLGPRLEEARRVLHGAGSLSCTSIRGRCITSRSSWTSGSQQSWGSRPRLLCWERNHRGSGRAAGTRCRACRQGAGSDRGDDRTARALRPSRGGPRLRPRYHRLNARARQRLTSLSRGSSLAVGSLRLRRYSMSPRSRRASSVGRQNTSVALVGRSPARAARVAD